MQRVGKETAIPQVGAVLMRTPEPTIRYKNVEEALTRIFKVSDDDLGAFRARLRNLRNLGIPQLPKTGSGTQIAFTRGQLIEMLIALELSRLGIPPRFVREIAGAVLQSVTPSLAIASHQPFPGPRLRMQMGDPTVARTWSARDLELEGYERLRALALEDRGKGMFLVVFPEDEIAGEGQFSWMLNRLEDTDIVKIVEGHPRVAFINLTSPVKMLDEYLRGLE